jgi:C4-type Zn-finger protein
MPPPLRDASDSPRREGFTCPVCGRFIVTFVEGIYASPHTGSPRRFCTPACRQAAQRRRDADASETTPLQYTGGRRRRLNPGG